MIDLNQFLAELKRLLKDSGSRLTESDVRIATKECRDAIYTDQNRFDRPIEEPFFNLVCSDDISVFTFFESQFSIFIVACDQRIMVAETDQFALCETEECKEMLRAKFEKQVPDIEIPRTLAEIWLS